MKHTPVVPHIFYLAMLVCTPLCTQIFCFLTRNETCSLLKAKIRKADFPNTMRNLIFPFLGVILPLISQAQNSAPEAQPIVDTIPAAHDAPWPGVVTLSVDATDVTRGIFRMTENIPVSAAG